MRQASSDREPDLVKIPVSLLAIVSALMTSTAHAEVVYEWTGQCSSGCVGVATARITLTDFYTPGTVVGQFDSGLFVSFDYTSSNMSFSVAFSDVDDEGAYFGIDPNFGVDSQVASTLGPFWVVDSPGDTSNWVARSGTALNTGASSAFVLITEVQPQPECAFEFTDQSTFTDAIESPTLIDFEGIVGSGEVLFLGSPGQFSEGGFSATTGSSRLFIVSWDTYSTGATMAVQQEIALAR